MPTHTDILVAKHLLEQHEGAVAEVEAAYNGFTAAVEAARGPVEAAHNCLVEAARAVSEAADRVEIQNVAVAEAIAEAELAKGAADGALTNADRHLERLSEAKVNAARTARAIQMHYEACGIG